METNELKKELARKAIKHLLEVGNLLIEIGNEVETHNQSYNLIAAIHNKYLATNETVMGKM